MTSTARAALLSLAGLALLAACSTAPMAAPAPQQEAPPLTAAEQEFVDQVRAIAPGIPGPADRIARRGNSTCTDLTATDAATGQPWPEAKIAGQARDRFSSGTYRVSSVQAAHIVDAARSTVCVP
jgi:hypothetical protein